MITRNIEKEIRILEKEFPVIAVLGPRQSGKTTLTRALFPGFSYVSLEETDNREFAVSDMGSKVKAIEIKSSVTFHKSHLDSLHYWQKLSGSEPANQTLIYDGNENFEFLSTRVIRWTHSGDLL